MLHKNRRWTVLDVMGIPEDLATKLLECTWCGCQGFRFQGMLWLNDSTGPDGAQEFAVIRESDGAQIESVTVSWCPYRHLADYIRDYVEKLETMEVCFAWSPGVQNFDHPEPCSLCQ